MAILKQERIKILAITILAFLATTIGALGYLKAEPESEPDRYYFRNSSGAVLFTHTRHQDLCEDCEDCHHELTQGAEDPTSCRDCHPSETAEGATFLGCQDCHEDPDYTPDYADHADLIDLEDHDCEGCHTARSVADAYHINCSDCHLLHACERFAGPEGEALCQACHLK